MTTHNFSIDDLAESLVCRLDRNQIFPPMLNDPKSFYSPTEDKTSSLYQIVKRSPNAFLICRKNVHVVASSKGNYNMKTISKATSILWNNATDEEKGIYKELADQVKTLYSKQSYLKNNKMK